MTDVTWMSPRSGPRPLSLGPQRLTMESAPQYPAAIINATNRCNLRCKTCFIFRDANPHRVEGEMRPDRMCAELERLRDRHGIVSGIWMGGEPMLRWRTLEKGVKLFPVNRIATNGTVPLKDFGPRVTYVVSLDGPREINDAVRGSGVFDKVQATIAAVPDDFQSTVIVQCVIQRQNQHHAEELVQALLSTKVQGIMFNFYVPHVGEVSPLAWDNVEEREEAVDIVLDLRRRYAGFVWNSTRSLNLMRPATAKLVTDNCPLLLTTLPLFLEGDSFVAPFCCYGNDSDCDRCGAWGVFFSASKLAGQWDEVLPPAASDRPLGDRIPPEAAVAALTRRTHA